MHDPPSPVAGNWLRRWSRWGAFVAIAIAFLAAPTLTRLPARLIAGCGKWIALAGILEVLSVVGFIVIFKLVFGARMSWRQGILGGLRGVGATTVLPAGGLVGPPLAARSVGASDTGTTRSAVAFAVITSAPGAIVLGVLGMMLWLGWPAGAHDAALTFVPGILAVAVLAAALLIRRSPAARGSEPAGRSALVRRTARGVRNMRDGMADARRLASGGNWKLAGSLAYYAFDNAVLWAAFRAYGQTPPLSVIVMGYLVGSLGSAAPLPAGIGAIDGGMIGALVLYGAPAAPAAAAVLLYRGISLALPVVVGGVAWGLGPGTTRRKPMPRSRRPSPDRPVGDAQLRSSIV